jgi:uncharacterized protein YlaI
MNCSICGSPNSKFFDEDIETKEGNNLPEDKEPGYYCDECVNRLAEEWWEEESSNYCNYNCDDCPSYSGYECLKRRL